MLNIFQRKIYLCSRGDLTKQTWGTVIVLDWQMITRPFKKALANLKKKKTSTIFNEHALSIREFMYRKIDNSCSFLILWNELEVSRNTILNIWRLGRCRIFLITTRFSVILTTGRVKITKNIPHFLNQKHYCFSLTRFAAWRVWNLYR